MSNIMITVRNGVVTMEIPEYGFRETSAVNKLHRIRRALRDSCIDADTWFEATKMIDDLEVQDFLDDLEVHVLYMQEDSKLVSWTTLAFVVVILIAAASIALWRAT